MIEEIYLKIFAATRYHLLSYRVSSSYHVYQKQFKSMNKCYAANGISGLLLFTFEEEKKIEKRFWKSVNLRHSALQ